MKKTLAVLTLLAGAVSGYSQGQIYIGDYLKNDFQITIWSPQLSGPALSGNSSAAFANGQGLSPDVPSGNTVYSGTPLGGANTGATVPTDYANANLWSVQLYAGAGAGDNVLSLQPVSGAVANFYSNPASVGYPGLWNSTFNATISTCYHWNNYPWRSNCCKLWSGWWQPSYLGDRRVVQWRRSINEL